MIGVERSTLNLGNLELAVGRLADAEALFRQAVDKRSHDHPECRGAAAADLARLQRRLGQPVDSEPIAPVRRAGAKSASSKNSKNGKGDTSAEGSASDDEAAFSIFEMGVVHLAAAGVKPQGTQPEPWQSPQTSGADRPMTGAEVWESPRTSGLAQSPKNVEAWQSPRTSSSEQAAAGDEPWRSPRAIASKATPKEQPPLAVEPLKQIPRSMNANSTSGRFDDGVLAKLVTEAAREAPAQSSSRSIDLWRRLALRAAGAGRPDVEFTARAALMRLHAAQGESAAAAFHGKRAANLAQAGRAALDDKSPSRDARRAFLRERRQLYVTLAQVLLDQQRLVEAELVLQLLKEDEGQQFIDGSSGPVLGRLGLSAVEQALQGKEDDAVRRLRAAEGARLAAVARLPLGANALLSQNRTQVEAARMRLALALPGLPAKLKLAPLSSSPLADASLVQDFLVGPGNRLAAFLTHVIDDAPQFEFPVSASERAQLAETQQRLPTRVPPADRARRAARASAGSRGLASAGSRAADRAYRA